MNVRTPITIVTGFLGAGKTTILSNLMKQVENERFAAIVNEFGEISIDETILKKESKPDAVEFHKVNNALIAYSQDTEFAGVMEALKSRNDVDRIIIETSGLAVPTAIIERLQAPAWRSHFVLDATLLIVDTPLFLEGKFTPPDAEESLQQIFLWQLECADVVVLNKIDYLPENKLLEAEQLTRSLCPTVRFLELAYEAKLDKNIALGLRLNERADNTAAGRVAPVDPTAQSPSQQNGHEHSGLGKHEHGILTHQHIHEEDPGWISFVLRTNDWQEADHLKEAFQVISESEPVLRIKGTTRVEGSEEQILFQGVRQRIEVFYLEPITQKQLVAHKDDHHLHQQHHETEHHSSHTHHHAPPEPRHHIQPDVTHAKHHHAGESSHGEEETDHRFENAMEEHGVQQGWLDKSTKGEIVFIGYHLNRDAVLKKLRTYTHTTWY
jgi:cobalamin biosynthesis protein CobW